MARPKNQRGLSVEVFAGSDGYWKGSVVAGVKADGDPRRAQRKGRMCESCRARPDKRCPCCERVAAKLRELEDQLAGGGDVTTGTSPWLSHYLLRWLVEREQDLEPDTIRTYRTAVECYLIPYLGAVRLDALRAEHVNAALVRIHRAISHPAAVKAHRVLRSALADARRRRMVASNEARSELVRVPRDDRGAVEEIVPLSVEQAVRILEVVQGRRNKARWLIAIQFGHRQGECLAFAWHRPDQPRMAADVDLDARTLKVREKLRRGKWRHGCADPHACGERLHKRAPCKPECREHARACPPPCARDCVEHARACPQRHGGGLVKGKPKSAAGYRTWPLDEIAVAWLADQREQQARERARAGSRWVESGLVFTTELGRPIDPRRDWAEWSSILDEAGVPHARLHDARHTAGTFLLMTGTTGREAMKLMGWSQESLLKRYQHPVEAMARAAGERVSTLLWGQAPTTQPTSPAATAALSSTDAAVEGSASAALPPAGAKILQFRRKAG